MIKGKFCKEKNDYKCFSDTFKAVVNKHSPLKVKITEGNSASFMRKALKKTIMIRSKLKMEYRDWSSRKVCKN